LTLSGVLSRDLVVDKIDKGMAQGRKASVAVVGEVKGPFKTQTVDGQCL
jgi:hypothetical protein